MNFLQAFIHHQTSELRRVVGRIRALIKKAPARKDAVEIDDTILYRSDARYWRRRAKIALGLGLFDPPVNFPRTQGTIMDEPECTPGGFTVLVQPCAES